MGKGILMNKLALPVYLIEGKDIIIYSSVSDLQGHLEPIDIRDNNYSCYDSEGRLLKLETDGRYIKLLVTEEEPKHTDKLEASLREYLIGMKESTAEEMNCDLPCLVNLSMKYVCIPGLKGIFRKLWRRLK